MECRLVDEGAEQSLLDKIIFKATILFGNKMFLRTLIVCAQNFLRTQMFLIFFNPKVLWTQNTVWNQNLFAPQFSIFRNLNFLVGNRNRNSLDIRFIGTQNSFGPKTFLSLRISKKRFFLLKT